MSEPQPLPRTHYQPSRERLALLLEQLLEFEPEGDKRPKFELAPEKMHRFEALPARNQKPAPVPIRGPEVAPIAENSAAVVIPKSKHAKSLAKKLATRPPALARTAAPKSRATSPAKKPKLKPELKKPPEQNSFHAVLKNHAKKQGLVRPRQAARESTLTPWVALTQRGLLGGLLRGWSWLNSKYKKSAEKRLRLSEVVSLGDKRFIALIKVEDREFLIGGAASGLSLLSPLDPASLHSAMPRRGTGSGGKAR